jgi:hypothetical protein
VLADGQVVTAGPHHEPDLFWALRGAMGTVMAGLTRPPGCRPRRRRWMNLAISA